MYLLKPNGYGNGDGYGKGYGYFNGKGNGKGKGHGNTDPLTPEHVICLLATKKLTRGETHENHI